MCFVGEKGKAKKLKINTISFCVRRESNPGPIETACFRNMATMDFTTKPQTLFAVDCGRLAYFKLLTYFKIL